MSRREGRYSSSSHRCLGQLPPKAPSADRADAKGPSTQILENLSMILKRFTLAAIMTTLATLMMASDAKSGIDPLTFSPAFPTAGQAVNMIFVTRPCYAFDADIPGAVEIIQSGNTIDIIWSGIVETDPILCNFPTGSASRGIGSFPAGNYLVRLSIRRNVPPHTVLPPIYEGQLVIGGQAPHTVPAAGLASLIALIILTVLAGHAWKRGFGALSAFLAVGMIGTCMIGKLRVRKLRVTIAPPVSTGPTKLLPCSGLHSFPADPLLA